jgi:hypothetical protein
MAILQTEKAAAAIPSQRGDEKMEIIIPRPIHPQS